MLICCFNQISNQHSVLSFEIEHRTVSGRFDECGTRTGTRRYVRRDLASKANLWPQRQQPNRTGAAHWFTPSAGRIQAAQRISGWISTNCFGLLHFFRSKQFTKLITIVIAAFAFIIFQPEGVRARNVSKEREKRKKRERLMAKLTKYNYNWRFISRFAQCGFHFCRQLCRSAFGQNVRQQNEIVTFEKCKNKTIEIDSISFADRQNGLQIKIKMWSQIKRWNHFIMARGKTKNIVRPNLLKIKTGYVKCNCNWLKVYVIVPKKHKHAFFSPAEKKERIRNDCLTFFAFHFCLK